MGQFLATALVTSIEVSKQTLDNKSVSVAAFESALNAQNQWGADLYDIIETEKALIYTIKPTLFQEELVPFLESFYLQSYGSDNREAEKTLDALRESKPDEWLSIAEEGDFYYFQSDNYGPFVSILVNNQRIGFNCGVIRLATAGKISMEQSGGLFRLYSWALRQAFAAAIAKALLVYIDG